jgi:hypothetical protein
MKATEALSAWQRIPWAARFALVFLIPWAVTICVAVVGEQVVPGSIKVDLWRFVASASFVLSGMACAYLASTPRWPVMVRALLMVLVLVWSTWFAFMFQLRSNCGDETEYLGQKPVVDECQ